MAVILETLTKMDYFTGLTGEEIESAAAYIAFEKTIEKGEMLLREGEISDYMYFIVAGSIKVYKKHPNGKEQILNIQTAGESLNDVPAFAGGGAAASMLAMTPVHLYAIKYADMERLFMENPRIARNVAGVLASRVRRDSSLVEVLSFEAVISRLARLILKQGEASGDGRLPHFNQQDLAAMVGTSRVVVNRSLRAMEEKGAIRLERRRIVITDEKALKELVT